VEAIRASVQELDQLKAPMPGPERVAFHH